MKDLPRIPLEELIKLQKQFSSPSYPGQIIKFFLQEEPIAFIRKDPQPEESILYYNLIAIDTPRGMRWKIEAEVII